MNGNLLNVGRYRLILGHGLFQNRHLATNQHATWRFRRLCEIRVICGFEWNVHARMRTSQSHDRQTKYFEDFYGSTSTLLLYGILRTILRTIVWLEPVWDYVIVGFRCPRQLYSNTVYSLKQVSNIRVKNVPRSKLRILAPGFRVLYEQRRTYEYIMIFFLCTFCINCETIASKTWGTHRAEYYEYFLIIRCRT